MNQILEKTVQQLGFNDIESFIKCKITETLLQDIAKFESQVKAFEYKYQINFETFEQTYFNPDVKEDIDKWHDNMCWDSALHSFNNAKQLLQILEKEGLTSYGLETKKLETMNRKAEKYYQTIEKESDGKYNS